MDQKTFSIKVHPKKLKPILRDREFLQFHGEDSLLFQAISPAFYIIRVFGLGPFQFSGDRLMPSNFHLIFSIIGIVFNTYVFIKVLVQFTIQGGQPLLGVTEQVKVVLNYGTSIVNILVAMCTRERIVEVWTLIQDFDYDAYMLGFPQMESRTKIRVWSVIFLNTLLWIWINQAGIFAFQETWLQNTSYLMLYISTCVAVYQFSGIVITIGLRFKHLNKLAETCGPNKTGWHYNSSKIDSKMIEKLHENLMRASRQLNSVYSWPLLLWLFNLSSHTVSNIYFIITAFMDHNFNIIIQICLAGWFFIYILQLMILHYACDFATTEANRMNYILFNWRKWQALQNKTKFESTLYLLNYELNFSAAGCCYVNLPLFRSITGLLTTYLIILLQLPDIS